MLLIQIILVIFFLFALSRVYLRFKGGQIRAVEFVFWTAIFGVAIAGVSLPEEVSKFATVLGVGRGVDLILYASIAVLFYLVFRLYVFIEDVRHEITEVVRQIALSKHSMSSR